MAALADEGAALASRSFRERFVEPHVVVLTPGAPPLELAQRAPALDDGGDPDPLDTGATVWRGGAALAELLGPDPTRWVTREEYMGDGVGAVLRKCPAVGGETRTEGA